MNFPALLDLAPEVAQAIGQARPVVALESTIIAHGMPYPQNLQTALRVQDEVRAHGATPATIALIDGRLKVGLSSQQIERLAQGGAAIDKLSRRDLPLAVAQGRCGATTVAATMMAAALARIRLFATGGIGGVHRAAAQSFDVSADLQELARTPVTVVCAGAKSILDLGLTLEYLETHGVPVIGYQCARLPAFFARDSAFDLTDRADTPGQIARAMLAQWQLGMNSGMVVANPIPQAFALPAVQIEQAIEQALSESLQAGIHGKALTPFLLERVNQISAGDSLAANIELVLNNARLAAAIAIEWQRLQVKGQDQ